MEMSDIIAALISFIMIILTTTINYEITRLIWRVLDHTKKRPRYLINLVVLTIFFAHTLSVWLYAIAFWIADHRLHIGSLGGNEGNGFMTYVYFSAATYSSLGIGDVFPTGSLRMITGVEVLNGLLLIGWSVTITYFSMQRFWNFHEKE